ARRLAHELGNWNEEAEIALEAATALDWMHDFSTSRTLVRQAEAVSKSPSDALRARLVLGKARALLREERRTEACAALEEAARLAEVVGDAAYETLIISLVLLVALLPE